MDAWVQRTIDPEIRRRIEESKRRAKEPLPPPPGLFDNVKMPEPTRRDRAILRVKSFLEGIHRRLKRRRPR